MKKIKEIILNNYKLIIPILFMIVLFIAFLIYYKVSVNSNYHVDKDEEVYQYFFDRKYEYVATVSKNKKDVIVNFTPKDIKINLDSTPIYLKNSDAVIFPEDMSVVMPTLNCSEYLSKGYSYLSFQKGIYTLVTNKYHDKLNHYFLYDGSDMYFFIENITLKVNNETIKLTPYSYVIVKYNNYLSYYDKASDTYKTLTIGNNNIIAENDYYKILLDKDIIDYQGNNVILTSSIGELYTIDKKDR